MTALPSLKYISPKPIAPAYPDYLFMRAGLEGYPDSAATQLQLVVKLVPTDQAAANVLKLISKPIPDQSVATKEQTQAQPAIAAAPAVIPIDPVMIMGAGKRLVTAARNLN